jgi:hypothetical protein
MIGFISQGSKENIRVTLEDRSGTVTSLASSSPTFTVKNDAGADKVTDVAASASGLVITCLLDTNAGGLWAVGEYRLFVKFTVGTEVVVKGPFYFTVTLT